MNLRRYLTQPSFIPALKPRAFTALRETLKQGYGFSDLRSDLMSGAVVAAVAIPLGMALAIASGVPPQHGLYTVIIAGFVVALLGGSRFQVTGPTAAFVVILAPISSEFGLGGLLISGLMAGFILVVLGVARMGRLIQFIPHPVTTGFTAGIAVVIATLQLKDFFGLQVGALPEHFPEKVIMLLGAMPSASVAEFLVGAVTLLILVYWSRFNRKIPAPLVALSFVSVAVVLLKQLLPELEIATIGSRFTYDWDGITKSGIPQSPPSLSFPWSFAGANGLPFELSIETIRELVPSAFAIAMLGAIESLLSAVVADGMAGTRHDPDSELIALGTGNILAPFFGGIAATGAIARTATNIRFGARSPLSAASHAVFTLLVVLIAASWVSYLPMAALAALLLLVAYNMSEIKHFFHIVRVAPRSDVTVLLICFFLTVIFDMVVGVTVGIVLAALLFMKRMAEVTEAHVVSSGDPQLHEPLPKEAMLYEIAGPLFFGAAQNAADAISGITDNIRVVIFSLSGVPAMDVTGLVAFESTIEKLTRNKRKVIVVGLNPQPKALLEKAGWLSDSPPSPVRFCESIDEAREVAVLAVAKS